MKQIKPLFTVIAAVAIGFTIFFVNKEKSPENTTRQPATIALSQFIKGDDIFITPDELYHRLGESNLVILDGNHPKVYAKGHIPGAINIGFKGLSRSAGKPGDPEWGTILPRQELRKKLESLGVTNTSLVVCYSDTFKGPGAGGRAAWQLRMAGLDNVKLLYGGMALWQQAGYKLTTAIAEVHPTSGLRLQTYNESYRADQSFVLKNIDSLVLVDVRSRDEFSGVDTSRGEARAGHIQNAVWLEWKSLLRPDSTPKSAQEIIALMADIGVRPGDDFVVY